MVLGKLMTRLTRHEKAMYFPSLDLVLRLHDGQLVTSCPYKSTESIR